MSISLALIPLALAVRGIMGKERFEEMAEASQVKVKTNFKDEEELVSVLRKAGFDAVKWGDIIKTDINDEKEFFFWEFIDGKWTASFGKYNSKESVAELIKKIEKTAGRKILVTNSNVNTDSLELKSYPTSFKDENLLMKTLYDYGVNYSKQNYGIINCSLGSHSFKLIPNKDSFYMIQIENKDDLKDIFMNLNNLDEDYRRNVQNNTYENLKSKVEEKGYKIESEEIMEDNSIVITINI
ncbi:hypothetical protein [Clostridium drakei]|uniref:Uncharacterized protein n=1 Tax=Clostridium drakei TaxID=332101 RepID=A0A2U8DP80_9CLOT|nr:hypothetical protein [Clostridium drakei]AWI04597.1 hypothetical protein B9W14_08860 [Clostridium drakei]